jgi:Histidine kinase
VHGGCLLGLLVCERQPEHDPLTAADDALLVDLARQVALALRNAELDSALQASLAELRTSNEELRRSRARLVAAADAERRRLERDLHDGAQQYLIALAVKLRLAADAVTGEAADLLEELQADVRHTTAELRALAHGIYPPLLISGGLSDALPAAASRTCRPVTVDVAGLDRHPPGIEAAVYFCCVEAIQNAAKHAGPTAAISLQAGVTGAMLWFEVRDDGAGFDPAGRPTRRRSDTAWTTWPTGSVPAGALWSSPPRRAQALPCAATYHWCSCGPVWLSRSSRAGGPRPPRSSADDSSRLGTVAPQLRTAVGRSAGSRGVRNASGERSACSARGDQVVNHLGSIDEPPAAAGGLRRPARPRR